MPVTDVIIVSGGLAELITVYELMGRGQQRDYGQPDILTPARVLVLRCLALLRVLSGPCSRNWIRSVSRLLLDDGQA